MAALVRRSEWVVPHFRGHRVDQITTFSLQRYRKARSDAGMTEATINRELATFLHLMNRAVEWRWIRSDQKPKIVRVAERRKARRALSNDQAEALYQAALLDHDPRLWLFVLIGLGTGMRHSEILARRYDEIDWNRNRFEIGKAKAGPRLQPFPQSVREGLLRQRELEQDRNGYLFPTERRSLCKRPHRTAMDNGFRRAVVAAGLDPSKVTPHLMRHTLVTNLSGLTDVATIQKISGHKTAAMVMHYTHVNDERIDNALRSLETNALSGITQKLHTAQTQPVQPLRGTAKQSSVQSKA